MNRDLDMILDDIGKESEQSKEAMRKHILTSPDFSTWEKLAVIYMMDHDVVEFKSTDVYKKIQMPKITWNNYVKPDLIKKGLLVQRDRYNYKFFDLSKMNIY